MTTCMTTAARGGSATRRGLLALVVVAGLLGGCATAYVQGASAYRQGRYDEAADQFSAVLAEDPARQDALVGLGMARYKLGARDEAIEALSRAVAQAPRDATARLYLALAYLQRGEDGRAEEHLTAYRALGLDARNVTLVDHALRLLRGAPLTAEHRAFVAASLEAAAAWQDEVYSARLAAQAAEFRALTSERVIYLIPRSRR